MFFSLRLETIQIVDFVFKQKLVNIRTFLMNEGEIGNVRI